MFEFEFEFEFVVTSHTVSLDWKITVPICGSNIVEVIKNLKKKTGRLLQVPRSWALVQTLLEYDLVDEFRLSGIRIYLIHRPIITQHK